MTMEVVNCFYEEKKNAEYLERQIEECPVREKRFIKRGIEYLYLKNVYDVTEIEDSLIDSYALWLQEHGIKDRKLIGVYQKSLRDWRMFHKQKEFVKLKEELEECDTVEQTLKNKVYAFMVEKKIYSLEEIDWDVRVSYEQYLEKTINKRNRPWYLSGLDKLKLFDIKKRNNSIRETKIRLKYQEKRIYLGYHPDYNLAKEFYYCKDAEGIIWDFSIKTSQRLKYQIFTVLNYALENFSERKLRRGYLAPLHFFYVYCIDRGISDGVQVAVMEQGQEIEKQGMKILCLCPGSDYSGETGNGASMVLSVSYREFDFLFTGDVEGIGEEKLCESIEKYCPEKAFEVLKAAHHGSRNSSSEIFLQKVRPKYTIISAGIENSYGHPHRETIERLEKNGSRILATANCGGIEITVEFGGKIQYTLKEGSETTAYEESE